jgi:hypothetical protein
VKAKADMVDADTLKQDSLVNSHVSKVTPQVLGIPNNVLLVKDHHLFFKKKLQLSKVNISKVQALEPQVLDIHILNIPVLKVQVLDM